MFSAPRDGGVDAPTQRLAALCREHFLPCVGSSDPFLSTNPIGTATAAHTSRVSSTGNNMSGGTRTRTSPATSMQLYPPLHHHHHPSSSGTRPSPPGHHGSTQQLRSVFPFRMTNSNYLLPSAAGRDHPVSSPFLSHGKGVTRQSAILAQMQQCIEDGADVCGDLHGDGGMNDLPMFHFLVKRKLVDPVQLCLKVARGPIDFTLGDDWDSQTPLHLIFSPCPLPGEMHRHIPYNSSNNNHTSTATAATAATTTIGASSPLTYATSSSMASPFLWCQTAENPPSSTILGSFTQQPVHPSDPLSPSHPTTSAVHQRDRPISPLSPFTDPTNATTAAASTAAAAAVAIKRTGLWLSQRQAAVVEIVRAIVARLDQRERLVHDGDDVGSAAAADPAMQQDHIDWLQLDGSGTHFFSYAAEAQLLSTLWPIVRPAFLRQVRHGAPRAPVLSAPAGGGFSTPLGGSGGTPTRHAPDEDDLGQSATVLQPHNSLLFSSMSTVGEQAAEVEVETEAQAPVISLTRQEFVMAPNRATGHLVYYCTLPPPAAQGPDAASSPHHHLQQQQQQQQPPRPSAFGFFLNRSGSGANAFVSGEGSNPPPPAGGNHNSSTTATILSFTANGAGTSNKEKLRNLSLGGAGVGAGMLYAPPSPASCTISSTSQETMGMTPRGPRGVGTAGVALPSPSSSTTSGSALPISAVGAFNPTTLLRTTLGLNNTNTNSSSSTGAGGAGSGVRISSPSPTQRKASNDSLASTSCGGFLPLEGGGGSVGCSVAFPWLTPAGLTALLLGTTDPSAIPLPSKAVSGKGARRRHEGCGSGLGRSASCHALTVSSISSHTGSARHCSLKGPTTTSLPFTFCPGGGDRPATTTNNSSRNECSPLVKEDAGADIFFAGAKLTEPIIFTLVKEGNVEYVRLCLTHYKRHIDFTAREIYPEEDCSHDDDHGRRWRRHHHRPPWTHAPYVLDGEGRNLLGCLLYILGANEGSRPTPSVKGSANLDGPPGVFLAMLELFLDRLYGEDGGEPGTLESSLSAPIRNTSSACTAGLFHHQDDTIDWGFQHEEPLHPVEEAEVQAPGARHHRGPGLHLGAAVWPVLKKWRVAYFLSHLPQPPLPSPRPKYSTSVEDDDFLGGARQQHRRCNNGPFSAVPFGSPVSWDSASEDSWSLHLSEEGPLLLLAGVVEEDWDQLSDADQRAFAIPF
eukprot:gene249-123_t